MESTWTQSVPGSRVCNGSTYRFWRKKKTWILILALWLSSYMMSQSLITYTSWCHWLHIASLLLPPLDQEMEWQRQCSMGKRVDWRFISNLHNSLLSTEHESYLMQRANLLEMTLMLGKIEGRRTRGWQRMKWLNDITDSMDMNLSKLWEMVKDREGCHAAVNGVTKSRT